MKVVLCTNRQSLAIKVSEFLKKEVNFLLNLPIDDNLQDKIYRINPDVIMFDFSTKNRRKWKLIENFTSAPSLRDIPLIVIFRKKIEAQIQKICEYDIYDYLIENFLKCELIMKINKAREIVDIKREFNRLLTKDPLTGAYNRSFLMERIGEEISWCSLYKDPLSLALIDIDFFKKINDTYGHLSGDRVLIELVSMAVDFFPNSMTIGRYGGEEFCLIMPSTAEKEAVEICENFRKKVARNEFHTFSGRPINLSISVGLTTFHGEVLISVDEIIQRADIALYKAKQSGRNRVIFEPFVVE
ncbi:GGDEF domain-containing protein [Thermodesulfovibrio sp.]|jgi:diguanylate cyclase (GGDEF)-like protein|uniref:GGDEF domain-containing protein n=2 Tax=Thermodesulfovibrionaceae TaxID=2811504 RepID=UPI0030983405